MIKVDLREGEITDTMPVCGQEFVEQCVCSPVSLMFVYQSVFEGLFSVIINKIFSLLSHAARFSYLRDI